MIESKMFVVIVVLATIFVGLAGYLLYLDRKISRVEKLLNEKETGDQS